MNTNQPTPTGSGPTISHPVKQRALGAVIGAAVGDALGAPFEFEPAGLYPRRFPKPVIGGTGEMIGGGDFHWEPGEFTDDTQMGIALAESILANGCYSHDTAWQWFRAWAATASDVGATTRASLRNPDWRRVANHIQRGAGNGALMRSFPFAVALLHADPDTVKDIVVRHGALTHPDPAAGWGAWIAVELCRHAIHGKDPFTQMDTLLDRLPTDLRPLFEQLLAADWTPESEHPSNGSVWGCLAEAVWAVRTTDTFEDALTAAIALGHDADTVGCVTGAIAGAIHGIQTIPSRWTTYINGRIDSPTGPRIYRTADLQRLTTSLLGLNETSDEVLEHAAGPVEVAPRLYAADLLGAATVPTDWAVVSLCRTGHRFDGHPVRRQVFLIDQEGDHNPSLGDAVGDTVRSIDAFLAEGRNVVVHCHGGRSRTGLALKAWKMHASGITEREAHQWLASRWHRYHDQNRSFVEFLRNDWRPALRPTS
ncbi:unannotated protein [freshwater metagenome]|uniref:Unannotated protein n=1 Tax=freshwater metagenome TaxID=449393 RepID=A0A6J7NLK7_9ZZZZ